jgi:hypothetical protein
MNVLDEHDLETNTSDPLPSSCPQPTSAGPAVVSSDVNSFRRELQGLLNKYSRENGSDTPDWILADYLIACLDGYDATVNARDKWYGCEK